jgi:UDP-glucuronate 4-epimerase
VRALEKPQGYMILNLGNGTPVPLMTYVDVLEKELGITAQKNMLPMQQGDVHETFADISQTKEKLGYEPKTSVEDGVKKFVEWYRQYKSRS